MDNPIQSPVDVIVSQTDKTNTPDPIAESIDKLFGLPGGDKDFKGGNGLDGRDAFDDVKKSTSNPSQAQPQLPKNIEDAMRQLQSERDKANAEIQKLKSEKSDRDNLLAFVDALYKDKQVREAFIAEVEPDLVKPKDPYTFIKESLGKEFGVDFTPDREEIHVAGTKSWLYNRRADQLLGELQTKQSKTPETIKDLLKQREQQKAEQLRAAELEKTETMKKLNWDEQAWDGFTKWMKSAQTIHFGQIYNGLLSQQTTMQPPFVTMQPGFNKNTSNEFSDLKKFFG